MAQIASRPTCFSRIFFVVPTFDDVSVVHPLHPSRSAEAAVTTGAAAEARSEDKVQLCVDVRAERHFDLLAVMGETPRAWCLSGQGLVRQLARKRVLRTGERVA